MMSDDEIVAVAFELARHGAKPIEETDIRVAINGDRRRNALTR